MIYCQCCGQRLHRGTCKLCDSFEGRRFEAELNLVILEMQADVEGMYRRAVQRQRECETEYLPEAIKA